MKYVDISAKVERRIETLKKSGKARNLRYTILNEPGFQDHYPIGQIQKGSKL